MLICRRLGVYTHFMPESQRRAVGKIPARLEMEESTLAKAVHLRWPNKVRNREPP